MSNLTWHTIFNLGFFFTWWCNERYLREGNGSFLRNNFWYPPMLSPVVKWMISLNRATAIIILILFCYKHVIQCHMTWTTWNVPMMSSSRCWLKQNWHLRFKAQTSLSRILFNTAGHHFLSGLVFRTFSDFITNQIKPTWTFRTDISKAQLTWISFNNLKVFL